MNIGIINYGAGNIGSIKNMLKLLGFESKTISTPEEIETCTHLILPGVGHFASAMEKLERYKMINAIRVHALTKKKPILGICLGMQLFCNYSDEGHVSGLRLVDFNLKKFKPTNRSIKVPHMGWNYVKFIDGSEFSKLFDSEQRFYFVHSYHIPFSDSKDVLTTTDYDGQFVSGFIKNNIVGVQFHPEKSHKYGVEFFTKYFSYYASN